MKQKPCMDKQIAFARRRAERVFTSDRGSGPATCGLFLPAIAVAIAKQAPGWHSELPTRPPGTNRHGA